jgi:predicted SAM-dependent methyltransferase
VVHLLPKLLNPYRVLNGATRRTNAFAASRARQRRFAKAKAWLAQNSSESVMVNVGCGGEPFAGWINLDLDPESRADVVWDINDGLPFPDSSCAFIYNEHFLEHIPVAEGVRFLTECRRCLHGGGVLRVAMPSLHEIVHLYNENEWAQEPWIEKHGFTWMKTRAEYINICFREWGHQWLYDAEELRRRLLEAGFTRIEDAAWGESKHPELRSRETRKETLLICEAAK